MRRLLELYQELSSILLHSAGQMGPWTLLLFIDTPSLCISCASIPGTANIVLSFVNMSCNFWWNHIWCSLRFTLYHVVLSGRPLCICTFIGQEEEGGAGDSNDAQS